MRRIGNRCGLVAVLLGGLALGSGCGQGDDTIAIEPGKFTEEEVKAIRSQDDLVNEEEGGAAKITRATRGTRKKAR